MKKEIWKILKDLENEKVTTNQAYHLLCALNEPIKQLKAVETQPELYKSEIRNEFNYDDIVVIEAYKF